MEISGRPDRFFPWPKNVSGEQPAGPALSGGASAPSAGEARSGGVHGTKEFMDAPAGAGNRAERIAAALGLPPGPLSASLVNFARFFSLPLNVSLLNRILLELRAVLPGGPGAEQGAASGMTASAGAAVLALCAAEAKGVSLSPEALIRYAAVLDPRRRFAEWNGSSGGDPDTGEAAPGDAGTPERETAPPLKLSGPRPDGNRAPAESVFQQEDISAILNRLPGKGRQGDARWAVYPARVQEDGFSAEICLRLLFVRSPGSTEETVSRLALDICAGKSGGGAEPDRKAPARSWLFVLDRFMRPAEGAPEGGALRVFADPAFPARGRAAFRRELSLILPAFSRNIIIEETYVPFADCLEPLSGPVDEAV